MAGTPGSIEIRSELLVVVLGPVSVEELVSVEDAPSARYGI